MIYLDTSILIPLVLPEAASEAVAAFFHALPSDDLAVSDWTLVEFSSAIAREVRMGGLAPTEAIRADARFDAMVRGSFEILAPAAADFDLARRYLLRFETALRGGDALHLAIAANHGAAAIRTLDKALIRAGAVLGLPVGGLEA